MLYRCTPSNAFRYIGSFKYGVYGVTMISGGRNGAVRWPVSIMVATIRSVSLLSVPLVPIYVDVQSRLYHVVAWADDSRPVGDFADGHRDLLKFTVLSGNRRCCRFTASSKNIYRRFRNTLDRPDPAGRLSS